MHLLFQSYYFASYQSDQERCFFLDFGHKQVRFSFCQLLSLRQKVQKIDLDTHFDTRLNYHGMEILSLCNREHLFVLDTFQVIDLKKLVAATFEILEKNSLVSV